jgi:hypothetical protein
MQPPEVTVTNRSPRLGRKEYSHATISLSPSSAYNVTTTTITTTTASSTASADVGVKGGGAVEYR